MNVRVNATAGFPVFIGEGHCFRTVKTQLAKRRARTFTSAHSPLLLLFFFRIFRYSYTSRRTWPSHTVSTA